MNPIQFLQNLKTGVRKADIAQRESNLNIEGGLGYGQSILDPRFKREMQKQGVTFRETPGEFLGAYVSRLIVDAANDGTRTYWWRYNHPLAIAQRGVEAGVSPIESPTARAATALAIAAPAISAAGTFNLLNPGELFRPKGFAQTYSEPGTDDRRETSQPAQELIERFFMGRTGDPLKYETAKKDIPSLTPQRYANYQNFIYNDRGLLNLGILKGTSENLQGYPEARMLGFPVTIPMAAGFAAGSLGAREAMIAGRSRTPAGKRLTTYYPPKQRAVRGMLGGALGSIAGVTAGNVTNEIIASANRPQLPTTTQYQDLTSDRI
jgi:hypothetical protein